MLLSSSSIELDKLYRLELQFAVEINGHSKIQLGADSLWNNRSGDDKHYWTGFQIIDISEENLALIQQIAPDD